MNLLYIFCLWQFNRKKNFFSSTEIVFFIFSFSVSALSRELNCFWGFICRFFLSWKEVVMFNSVFKHFPGNVLTNFYIFLFSVQLRCKNKRNFWMVQSFFGFKKREEWKGNFSSLFACFPRKLFLIFTADDGDEKIEMFPVHAPAIFKVQKYR